MDHGYARFNHVRIPREHMLSKFAEVTPDGRYMQPPHAKMSYGGVSNARYSHVAQNKIDCTDALSSFRVIL